MKILYIILCLTGFLFAQDSIKVSTPTKKPIYLSGVVSSIDTATKSVVIKDLKATTSPSAFSIKVGETIWIKYIQKDTTSK